MNTEKLNLRFGLYVTLSLVIMTIITWAFAMMAVPPAGPYCFDNCMTYPYNDLLNYYPRDYIWMYLAILQLFTYLIFFISNHFIAPAEKKLFSFISVAFALGSSIILLTAYFIQFSVIPASMMHGETEGIALLTQYNGHGIFIAMEDLGYIMMSISYFFLAFIFGKTSHLEKTIRLVPIISFLLTALSFIVYTVRFGIERSYRFEVAAISLNWLTTIIVGILLIVFISGRIKLQKKQP